MPILNDRQKLSIKHLLRSFSEQLTKKSTTRFTNIIRKITLFKTSQKYYLRKIKTLINNNEQDCLEY